MIKRLEYMQLLPDVNTKIKYVTVSSRTSLLKVSPLKDFLLTESKLVGLTASSLRIATQLIICTTVYATLSSNGSVVGCKSHGSLDSGLWIAGSVDVTADNNEIYESTTGK
jgi:hypothetical protein